MKLMRVYRWLGALVFLVALLPGLAFAWGVCDDGTCQGQAPSCLCHCACHLSSLPTGTEIGMPAKQVVFHRPADLSLRKDFHVSSFFRPPQD